MLRIPADIWSQGVDQRQAGCHHHNTRCQATPAITQSQNNERTPNCLRLLNIPQPQFVSNGDKRVLCAFCNEAGGELWTMHNTRGPGADMLPAHSKLNGLLMKTRHTSSRGSDYWNSGNSWINWSLIVFIPSSVCGWPDDVLTPGSGGGWPG